LHPSEILQGYKKGAAKALEFLEQQVVPGSEVLDVKDQTEVARRLRVRHYTCVATGMLA
jgi:hypothetical protein